MTTEAEAAILDKYRQDVTARRAERERQRQQEKLRKQERKKERGELAERRGEDEDEDDVEDDVTEAGERSTTEIGTSPTVAPPSRATVCVIGFIM